MRSSRHTTSPSTPSLDNAFSPTYLARLRERDDGTEARRGPPPVLAVLRLTPFAPGTSGSGDRGASV